MKYYLTTIKMRITIKNIIGLFAIAMITFLASCGGDEPTVDPPRAAFDFTIDGATVTFQDLSVGADSYSWDFGDNTGTSTEAAPSYTYTESGSYMVSLTVTNAGGTDTGEAEVTVRVPGGNLVNGGDMTDANAWNAEQLWTDPDNGVDHGFTDGVFRWDNTEGTLYSQYILWQEIELEAGIEYVFSADVAATEGVSGIWFEVLFGKIHPSDRPDGGDYTDGGKRVNLNDECGADPFEGNLLTVASACGNDDAVRLPDTGVFTLTEDDLTANGTIFLVFKSGSWDNADNYRAGMTLDNVEIKENL